MKLNEKKEKKNIQKLNKKINMDELNNNKENEIKTNEIIDAPKEVQKRMILMKI